MARNHDCPGFTLKTVEKASTHSLLNKSAFTICAMFLYYFLTRPPQSAEMNKRAMTYTSNTRMALRCSPANYCSLTLASPWPRGWRSFKL